MARIKDHHVPHEENSRSTIPIHEQYVSMQSLETCMDAISEPPETTEQSSMSQTMQISETRSVVETLTSNNQTPSSNRTTPQSSPPDFSSFFHNAATDIPNINCRAHGTSRLETGSTETVYPGSRPTNQIPHNLSSSSINPAKQSLTVIDILTESSAGDYSSSSATQYKPYYTQTNLNHFENKSNASSPYVIYKNGPASVTSQNYTSEIFTESLPSQDKANSSGLNVNTPGLDFAQEWKSGDSSSVNNSSRIGKRGGNLPLPLNTNVSNFESSNVYFSGKLSTPIQASSPGIAHSKPVFIDISSERLSSAQPYSDYNNTNFASRFNPDPDLRSQPANTFYYPQQSNTAFGTQNSPPSFYNQFNHMFPNTAGFPFNQQQNSLLYHRPPWFHSLPPSFSQFALRPTYPPSFNSQFSSPASLTGYQRIPDYFTGQTPNILSNYAHFTPGMVPPLSENVSRGPITGQTSLERRYSGQNDEHKVNMDYDFQQPYNVKDFHATNLGNLSQESSTNRNEEVNSRVQHCLASMLPDETEYVRALVQHQKRQKQKLLEEIIQQSEILNQLRMEVNKIERNTNGTSNINRNFPNTEDISGLCEDNRRLQTDIQLYMNEVEMYKNKQIPVNNMSPLDQQNFFENIPTGQQDFPFTAPSDNTSSQSPTLILPPRPPPPRPPPPLPVRQPLQQQTSDRRHSSSGSSPGNDIFRVPPVSPAQATVNSGESDEGEPWNCFTCTFSNHPLIDKCEMCEMPRQLSQNPSSASLGRLAVTSQQPISSIAPGPDVVSSLL